MRVVLSEEQAKILFTCLAKKDLGPSSIAKLYNFSERTVIDWSKGKYSIPFDIFYLLLQKTDLTDHELDFLVIDEREQKRRAGRLGYAAQKRSYGDFASAESRMRGGVASYEARKHSAGDIFTRKQIKVPIVDLALTEFIGVMIGDGSISRFQAAVSVNMTDDADYVPYIYALFKELFDIQPTIKNREKANCTIITASSANLVEYLIGLGLPLGDKIKQGIRMPDWLRKDPLLAAACVRGIFDTDGCIFQETHRIRGKTYSYPRISIVSHSPPLINDIQSSLRALDINSRVRGKAKVNIENFTDIEKFFRIVGSSNPKHHKRYKDFMERSHSG